MADKDLTDIEVLTMVVEADKALFDQGNDIKQRLWRVPQVVMKRLGYVGYVIAGIGKPKILDRIEAAFRAIYHPHDIAVGGHIGVFMFRDVFVRIGVPHVYGTVSFDPVDAAELTPVQRQLILNDPDQGYALIDQVSDVGDIQYGVGELKEPYRSMDLVARFAGLSRLHLHAAAAVLTGGFDYRGAVQSALLATELALKGAAATKGLTEDDLKKRLGHNMKAAADVVGAEFPNFDLDRVKRVVSRQPDYVPNRYASEQPKRREVGHLVMGAQYIVSEVVRQLSDRNFRNSLHPPLDRHYPA